MNYSETYSNFTLDDETAGSDNFKWKLGDDDDRALFVTTLCTFVLWLANAGSQILNRSLNAKLELSCHVIQNGDIESENKKLPLTTDIEAMQAKTIVWKSILSDDVENLPLFLIVIWGSVLSTDDSSSALHISCVVFFTFFRLVGISLKLQPPPKNPKLLYNIIFTCTQVLIFIIALNAVIGSYIDMADI
jgi:hypothetical protein